MMYARFFSMYPAGTRYVSGTVPRYTVFRFLHVNFYMWIEITVLYGKIIMSVTFSKYLRAVVVHDTASAANTTPEM